MKCLVLLIFFAGCALPAPIYAVKPFSIAGELAVFNQINDSGEVAGYTVPSSGGRVTAIEIAPTGEVTTLINFATAYGINNSGQIVGSAHSSGFVYSSEVISYFSVPGSYGTRANGINDAGVVVGDVMPPDARPWQGFIRNPNGRLVEFSAPNATNGTEIEGINDSGEVVGYYEDSAGLTHGFEMQSNGIGFKSFDICHYLPGRGAAEGTLATAINNRGEIAGYCFSRTGTVGFILEPNGTFSTYGFDPNPTVGNQTNTMFLGINDEDVVSGSYFPNGQAAAFIATPVPEPSLAGLLFASCLMALAARKLRKGDAKLVSQRMIEWELPTLVQRQGSA